MKFCINPKLFVSSILIAIVFLANVNAGDFKIVRYTIDGGGITSIGDPYVLDGTIGQPDAAWSAGDNYELIGGFWSRIPYCIVNFEDFARFTEYWLETGAGLPADLYEDNVVDPLDLNAFVNEWLQYCPRGWPLAYDQHSGIPMNGIIAHWSFDEGSGTIAHDSADDHDGTLVGDANWVDGISGKALDFDGNGDYVDVPDANSLDPVSTQEITIAAWVYTTTYEAQNSSSFFAIVGKQVLARPDGSYLFGLWNDGAAAHEIGKLSFVVASGGSAQTLYSNSLVPLNNWVHVAITRDSSNITKIYINGQVDVTDSSTITQAFEDNDKNLRIGYSGRYADYFYGSLDEVRIYNRALTSDEIEHLYQNP